MLRCFFGSCWATKQVAAAGGGKGKKEYVNYIVKVYNRRTQKNNGQTDAHTDTHTQKVVVLLLKVFNLLA